MRYLILTLLLLIIAPAHSEVIVTTIQDTTLHVDLGGGNTAEKPLLKGTILALIDASPTGHPNQVLAEDKATNVRGYLDSSSVDLVAVKDNVSTTAQGLATEAKSQPKSQPAPPVTPGDFIPDPNEPPLSDLISFIDDVHGDAYTGGSQPNDGGGYALQKALAIQDFGIHNLIEFSRHKPKYFFDMYRRGEANDFDKIQDQIILPAVQALTVTLLKSKLPDYLELKSLTIGQNKDNHFNVFYSFSATLAAKGDLYINAEKATASDILTNTAPTLTPTYHAGDVATISGHFNCDRIIEEISMVAGKPRDSFPPNAIIAVTPTAPITAPPPMPY